MLGLARRPIAHTSTFMLELPIEYENYEDFCSEFEAIFFTLLKRSLPGELMLCSI